MDTQRRQIGEGRFERQRPSFLQQGQPRQAGVESTAARGRQQIGGDAIQQRARGTQAHQRFLVCGKAFERLRQCPALAQRLHQTHQLARAHLAQAQARGDAFHVGAAFDLRAQGHGQRGVVARIGAQRGQGLQARACLGAVAPGLKQPVFELAAAHAGHAGVEQGEQRGRVLAAQGLGQFEVAPGAGGQVDEFAIADAQSAKHQSQIAGA